MSARVKLSFSRPLRGLRPQSVALPEPGSDKTTWLFDLRERAKAEARQQDAFRTTLEGIDRAVEAMTATVEQRMQEVGAQATELGLALASEVLGIALDQGLADPTPTVVRCLRDAASDDNQVEVFLAPDDLGPVLDRLESHPELRESVARAGFSADPELDRGAVRLETAFGRLLYDPAEVLQRICDEVRRELAE